MCTTRGDVCLIDDTGGQQKLHFAKNLGFKIQCITLEAADGAVWIGGKAGNVRREDIDTLREVARKNQNASGLQREISSGSSSPKTPSPGFNASQRTDLLALASILGRLVVLDNSQSISMLKASSATEGCLLDNPERTFPAHSDAIQGVEIVDGSERKVDFVTWSSDGHVNCWKADGTIQSSFDVEVDQLDTDEDLEVRNVLKVVRSLDGGKRYVTGDKYGVLRYVPSFD